MGELRLLIGTMFLLVGLAAAGCSSDADVAGTEGRAETVQTDGPEDSDDSESSTTASERTTSTRSIRDCPVTTTTTGTTTSSGLPSVCELIGKIPPDELPPEEARDYVVWSGTISGSVQTPGCESVSQSGEIILVVFANGDLSGAGETVAGAYRCDNGASIPAMTNSYGIDGRMTDVFALTFDDRVQLSSGPIDGGHAVIVQDTGSGLVTIELVCENC